MTVSPTVPFFILGREPSEASRMKHATGRPDACAWSTTRSSSDGVNRMSLAIERRSPLTATIPRGSSVSRTKAVEHLAMRTLPGRSRLLMRY